MRGAFRASAVAWAIAAAVGCGQADKTDKTKKNDASDKTAKVDNAGTDDKFGKPDPEPARPTGAGAVACSQAVKAIIDAQNEFANERNERGQPEFFATGGDMVTTKATGVERYPRGVADPNRGFAYLVEHGFLDAPSLACPDDPFVVALDPVITANRVRPDRSQVVKVEKKSADSKGGNSKSIPPEPVSKFHPDLHGSVMTEGKPAPVDAGWASASSTAATTKGRTFFSYSMQTDSTDYGAYPTPKMYHKIPLVGDRNPYCETLVSLAGEAPTAKSEAGNSWNHAREFQNVGFSDGHVEKVAAANAYELPVTSRTPNLLGFDYIYGPGGAIANPKPPTDGKCLPPGSRTPEPYTKFGSWLID